MSRFCPFVAVINFLAGVTSATGGTIAVTTLQIDAPPSQCELDEAIIMVNDFPNDERFNCQRNGDGPDVIVFDGSLQGAINLNEPLPAIERTLTIRGRGADRIRINGGQLHQAITVNAGVTFALEAITIENASAGVGNGGALLLLNGSQASLRDCRITGGSAANGGGIYADDATLRVERCLIDDNSATDQGGGILSRGSAVDLVNSTVSGNTADEGGGLALIDAGGSPGTSTLRSVTLADNAASSGGNVFVAGVSDLEVQHTILAIAAAGESCDGSITSLDWNLDDDGSCGLIGLNDLDDTPAGLAVLADNGGPTDTHALQIGSAAIDAGDNSCSDASGAELQTDQRGTGFPRRTDGDSLPGAYCDIGAFEVVPEPDSPWTAALFALALLRQLGSGREARRFPRCPQRAAGAEASSVPRLG